MKLIDFEVRYLELVNKLKEQDYRLTPQRLELIRLIAISDGHPNAAQLFNQSKQLFPTMSQATVYKTLALLKEMGQVYELDLHGDSHYDGKRPDPHSHIICMQCNKIVDADFEFDSNVVQNMEKWSGFQISRPQVIFWGICSDCRVNKKM